MLQESVKKYLARAALLLILFVLALLVYGAVTHSTGLIMIALFCLIVLPVVPYLILKVAGLLKDYNRDSHTDDVP